MNKHKVAIGDLMPIDIWVTTNVAVYRQTSLWTPINMLYQFVPTMPRGYVVLTKANERMHCRQLQGYTLHRPASLTVTWLSDKVINFRKLTMVEGMMWHANYRGRWKDIGTFNPRSDDWGEIPR